MLKPSKNMWLTTEDNPYNPFKQWDDWYAYDMMKGYDTCALIMKYAPCSEDNFTEKENEEQIQYACNRILDYYNDEFYKLVFEEDKSKTNEEKD